MSDSGTSTSVINYLKCWLFGHDWDHRPNGIPEDRQTFRCARCHEWGFNPPNVGENHVPARYVDPNTAQSGESHE